MNKFFLAFMILMNAASLFCDAAAEGKKQPQTQPQSQTQPQTEVMVIKEILLQGTYSGMREPLTQIITTKEDWQNLWTKHVSVLVPQPPLPLVDFESQVLVAIFTGEKRTSGYRILIKDTVPEGNDIVLKYHLTEPPANSFTLQVLTQPFVILKLSKPKGTVRLVKE